jgi:hypothetical protein
LTKQRQQQRQEEDLDEVVTEHPAESEPEELPVVYPGPHERVTIGNHGEFIRDVERRLPREVALDLAKRRKVRLVSISDATRERLSALLPTRAS